MTDQNFFPTKFCVTKALHAPQLARTAFRIALDYITVANATTYHWRYVSEDVFFANSQNAGQNAIFRVGALFRKQGWKATVCACCRASLVFKESNISSMNHHLFAKHGISYHGPRE